MERRVWLFGVIVGLSLGVSTGSVWHRSRRIERGRAGVVVRRSTRAATESEPLRALPQTPDTAAPSSPPPPPGNREEAPPPAPRANYVWVEGRWVWHAQKRKYEWEPGFWCPAPPVYLAEAGTVGHGVSASGRRSDS